MVSFPSERTVSLRDQLTGALIGIARATDGNEHLISASSTAVIMEGLYATLPNGNYHDAALEGLIKQVEDEKRKMVPDCFLCANPCGKNDAYDMTKLLEEDENIRSLKCLILSGIRSMAAYAWPAAELGYHDGEVDSFFYKALTVIGIGGYQEAHLIPILLEMGRMNLKCLEMPGKAIKQG